MEDRYIYTYMQMHLYTYTYLHRKQFLQDVCILNMQTVKCAKINCSKVSDASHILNNHDNENEVTFILVVTASRIFHSAATEEHRN